MTVERDIDRHAAAQDDLERFHEWCEENDRDPEDDAALADFRTYEDEARAEFLVSQMEDDYR